MIKFIQIILTAIVIWFALSYLLGTFIAGFFGVVVSRIILAIVAVLLSGIFWFSVD